MLTLNRMIRRFKYKLNDVLDKMLHFIVYPILCVVNLYKPVKIARLNEDRIGHLAVNTEVYLRRVQLGMLDKNQFTIFIANKSMIANQCLYDMLKRYIYIVDNIFLFRILYPIVKFNSEYWQDLPLDSNEYCEMHNANPIMCLTETEEQLGRQTLKQMGIGEGDWYVCIFARDNAYLKTIPHYASKDFSYHDYRDADIDTYVEAIKYVIDRGGFVVRLGKVVAKKMSYTHSNLIDYPLSEYRSDFMDIYLQTKAKFIVANTSGIGNVAWIFDIPYCGVNIIPIDAAPFAKHNIYIPKKLKSKITGQWISLSEYFDNVLEAKSMSDEKAIDYLRTEFYDKKNIEIINNSEIEILEIVMEMNERLDGTFFEEQDDINRFQKYRDIHKKSYQFGNVPSPIGRDFLKRNEWLLNC